MNTKQYVKKEMQEVFSSGIFDADNLLAAGLFCMMLTDSLINRALKEKPPESPVMCGPGCPTCCQKSFDPHVTIPEILCIYKHIKENDITVNGVPGDSCGLVDVDGSCAIHSMRPVRCRGWNSCDLEWCKRVDRNDEFELHESPVYFPQFNIARQVHFGLIDSLAGHGQLDPIYPLTSALKNISENGGINSEVLFEGIFMAMAC